MLRTRPLIPFAALLLVAGCQERLASPADCPDLCPGGYTIYTDTLYAIPGGDSAATGYLRAGQGSSLRVSWQFPVSEDRAVYRFTRRTDSLTINGKARAYTVDSLALELSILYRDTTVHGLKVYLYRVPVTFDSTTSFAEVEAAFTPATVVDSFLVDDTLQTKRLRVVYIGSDTSKLSLPAADSARLALGVQIRAAQGTGIRIGGAGAGSAAPSFINYVTVPNSDTSTVNRIITPSIQFNSYVSQAPPALDPDLLTIGGTPSSRSLIRFPWSARLKDSATLIRATLQLLPSAPLAGLTGDTALVVARPILADFGAKSPAVTATAFTTSLPVLPGVTDTVALEVRTQLTSWQGSKPVPPALTLQLSPEVSSFSRFTFGSTRTPGKVPRVIVTYALKFPFGEP
ncbi:MAG TPA: hypothetical protein VLD58_15005 [Gemmatimonadales bacterium]|nr:hypothetical protein [Gemmatimonadales bacterium]